MKKWKILFWLSIVLGLISSHAMFAVVAYNFCNLSWGMRYAGWSAGPNVAFFASIPFLFVMIVCFVIAIIAYKKSTRR